MSATVIWAAGVAASPLARELGCELDRSGRIVVTPTLEIPGLPGHFALGDIARVRRSRRTAAAGARASRQAAGNPSRPGTGPTHPGGDAPQSLPLPQPRKHGDRRPPCRHIRDASAAPEGLVRMGAVGNRARSSAGGLPAPADRVAAVALALPHLRTWGAPDLHGRRSSSVRGCGQTRREQRERGRTIVDCASALGTKQGASVFSGRRGVGWPVQEPRLARAGFHAAAPGFLEARMEQDREQNIRMRAYEIWEREGRKEGGHEVHWHQAERELRDEQSGSDHLDETADDAGAATPAADAAGGAGPQPGGSVPSAMSPSGAESVGTGGGGPAGALSERVKRRGG